MSIAGVPSLRQLEYVVALADLGQFGETARHCGVSQPALSKQVREVEQLLGAVLFERARPRVLLTDVGRSVVDRARRLLADARELAELAQAHEGEQPSTLRLGVIPTVAPYGLPGLLAKLRSRHPNVTCTIHELQTEHLLEQLHAGTIDVGLLARPFETQGLTGPDLVLEPFVLVAPEGHALGRRKAARVEEIAGASLILMQDGHCLRDQAMDICAQAGPAPATGVEAASVSTLVRLVESGLGATLLPASALRAEVHPGQGLVARGFSKPVPGRTLTVQWRSSSPHADWYRQIGELLRAHYLSINETMPKIAGPQPKMRSAD